ncbi:hypothetical protein WA158_003713 [Blastocystis sp. Blastoise]
MKYLDYPNVTALCTRINGLSIGDVSLRINIIPFSCKRVGDDKKESKKIENDMMRENDLYFANSPKGCCVDQSISKIYANLVQTLNATFPDYDFSNVQPDSFVYQNNIGLVMNTVNRFMSQIYELQSEHILEDIWESIDKIVVLKECTIYSYVPDVSTDPMGDNNIWSFNYFFYNNKLKKLVYFTCSCRSQFSRTESTVFQNTGFPDDEDEMDDEDYIEW